MEGKGRSGEIARKIPEIGVGDGQTHIGIHDKRGDAEVIVKGGGGSEGVEIREEGSIGKGVLGGNEEKNRKWEGVRRLGGGEKKLLEV